MTYVIAIREYGADEVSEIVGPFDNMEQAHSWLTSYSVEVEPDCEPEAWYDILELQSPINKTRKESAS
jgi:hypothetical protein